MRLACCLVILVLSGLVGSDWISSDRQPSLHLIGSDLSAALINPGIQYCNRMEIQPWLSDNITLSLVD